MMGLELRVILMHLAFGKMGVLVMVTVALGDDSRTFMVVSWVIENGMCIMFSKLCAIFCRCRKKPSRSISIKSLYSVLAFVKLSIEVIKCGLNAGVLFRSW
jgi:hypothetical protein